MTLRQRGHVLASQRSDDLPPITSVHFEAGVLSRNGSAASCRAGGERADRGGRYDVAPHPRAPATTQASSRQLAETTDIFITRPGGRCRSIDALMTNFHLPRSTLFMLVSAFAGLDHEAGLYPCDRDRLPLSIRTARCFPDRSLTVSASRLRHRPLPAFGTALHATGSAAGVAR